MTDERYARIKEAVGAAQVARDHGLETQPDGQGREKTLCPFHHDHDPSLKLFPDGGYKCFACDASGDAVSLEQHLGGHGSASEAAAELEERYGMLRLAGPDGGAQRLQRGPGKPDGKTKKHKRVKEARREEVARWVIRDADGVARAQHIRHRTWDEEGKEGKSYSYRNADGSWEAGAVKPKELPFYLSELVSGYDPKKLVLVVEGEKAADAARRAGLQVVATACGTNVTPPADALAVLRGFEVTCWADNDPPGKKHMAKVSERLLAAGARVRWHVWPDAPEKGDVADHPAVASGDPKALSELCRTLAEAPAFDPARHKPEDPKANRGNAGQGPLGEGDLPAIRVSGRQMRDVTADSLNALIASNKPPAIFERGGEPARVGTDERDEPVIQTLGVDEIRHHMCASADYYKLTAKGEVNQVNPPSDIAKDILASPARPFPALTGIVETPYLRPDGTVHSEPGYDPATRYYYAPAPGFAMPPVPEFPTPEDVAGALELLAEAVGEFPYDSEASAANALALLLTPIVRQAIRGPAPLLLIEKPQAGTGASLLAEVAALVGTGRAAEMLGAPQNEDEWRKQITAKLMAGSPVITLDNIDGPLEAPSLARALTARTWVDRELGVSKIVRVPQNATWIGTGNNIILRGDLPRRCVSIRLDAKTSRPWQRKGFRHPDLTAWVERNRGELVRALLVLARAWWAAGRPAAPGLVKLGSFESWAETVGGILAHAGVEGFLANSERVYQKAAQGDAEWESFYAAWHGAVGEKAVTVGQLTDEIEKDDELREAVPPYLQEALDKSRGSFVRRLGNALSRNEVKRFGEEDFYVERAGMDHKVVTWRLKRGQSEAAEGGFRGFYKPVTSEIARMDDDFHMERGETNPSNPANPPQSPGGGQVAAGATSGESTAERAEANSPNSQTHHQDAEPPDDAGLRSRVRELLEEERLRREGR